MKLPTQTPAVSRGAPRPAATGPTPTSPGVSASINCLPPNYFWCYCPATDTYVCCLVSGNGCSDGGHGACQCQ
jgi:hypothetical protein